LRGLAERDPVAPPGGGDRRLHPRRPRADDEHAQRPLRRTRLGLALAPGARALDAAEPAIQPHAADALLVAGKAEADCLGRARARLRGEVGVRDLTAHDPDEV